MKQKLCCTLDLRETEKAIKSIKDFFEKELSGELKLQRVSAPRFVRKGSGINDDLSGKEKKVSFTSKFDPRIEAEIVFSLAKWKRMALADYGFKVGEGLYTDMDAIRADEDVLDSLHSMYVDQWDWEKIIVAEERTLDDLKATVRKIYSVLKKTERMLEETYSITPVLPEDITFVHTEDLAAEFPELTPKQREFEVAKRHKAIFLIGIGAEIAGKRHEFRAPDYDDWTTPTIDGKKGLNGDIIIWYPILERDFEISSMGIRVDKVSMLRQLKMAGCEDRKEQYWHKRLLSGELPLSVGGGIGQSRLCMFFLRKKHIGEVQASIWPEEMLKECKEQGIALL